MRSVAACCLLSGLCSLVLTAGGASETPAPLTVLFHFDGPYSETSVLAMKREFASIIKGSGLTVDWRERDEVRATDSFANFVVVKFRGKCVLEPIGQLYDERGPFALTYSTDGTVLPFSEIECDKVTHSVRGALDGDDFARADMLFGRALARVVAHEVFHMIAGTPSHAENGIAKRALSGSQLISGELRFGAADLERIHAGSQTTK